MTLTIYWKERSFQVFTISSFVCKNGFIEFESDEVGVQAFNLLETFGISIAP